MPRDAEKTADRKTSGTDLLGGDMAGWQPQVDVLRRGDELVVRADLPGLSKDDISVDVRDDSEARGRRLDI